MQADAAGDPGASPGRGPSKQINTMEQFNKLDNLYLLDCGNAQSSWRAWQKTAFDKARTFDRQLAERYGLNLTPRRDGDNPHS